MSNETQQRYYQHPVVFYGKRCFDLIAALAGLMLLLMLLPWVALAIKWDSQGPIFYRQMRVGQALPDMTKLFMIIKFRTMTHEGTTQKAQWAEKNDPRITRLGKWLRKTRIDELPQLINVLKGDMSLIGPRPEQPGLINKLEAAIPFYSERIYGVLPGITGIAQVKLGYDNTLEDVQRKIAYDYSYALSLTKPLEWLKMESHILFETVFVVLKGQGQ